ncbi:phage capsid protein [Clostridium sp. MF28]|uniref:phage major capsid protein n=1 Tax=Clostridium TaxID=1485 RepID=UPI000CF9576E|nr:MULTISPECIES: phage major capsid protein [Clostridium]AVK50666.1 phage capsid protein [Clostridium sp. MF28]PSM59004.1 phage major capsid protein [Clostridium diolis]
MNKKAFIEKRNNLIGEMEGLINKATEEVRSFDETETNRMNEIKTEVANIDATLKTIEETRELVKEEIKEELNKEIEVGKDDEKMEKRELETKDNVLEVRAMEDEKIFVEMINGKRALDVANNGAIIPETIANRIIEKVKELSPIVSMTTIFNEGGNLKFPVYDDTTNIEATYVDDMQELTEQTGKFTVVSLQNFIVGSLAKISKSLANRTNIDVAGFAINKIAQALAEFLEKELITGSVKMKGLTTSTNTVVSSVVAKIGADDLIDVQLTVPEVFQSKCVWIMNKTDFAAIRKLKDGEGNYLLTKDYVQGFGYTLLGKIVYISENADAVYYGDMSGLYVKFAQTVEIQVLLEKYATQHAIGVVGYLEADSAIIEPQKIVKFTKKVA